MASSLHFEDRIPARQEASRLSLTRRQSLRLLGVVAGGLTLPLAGGCDDSNGASTATGDWPSLDLEPITASGYGTDPNLVQPPQTPWPLTMSQAERAQVSVLVDIIIPREGQYPAASEVGVTDLVDEWISAPYPRFQSDRMQILSMLAWLDEEAGRRFDRSFLDSKTDERLQVIDDIAFESAESSPRFGRAAQVFDALRRLVTAAYFASPEGAEELGYQGNVPIAGDYPGPSAEAKAHLEQVLADLDLADYAYDGAE